MSNNALLIKLGGASLVAAGGVGSGGYFAVSSGIFNTEYFLNEEETEKNYLIVKSVTQNEPSKKLLYEKSITKKIIKNFKCTFDTHNDEKCEIYKLSDKEKSLSTLTIKNNPLANSENIKKEDNFFKLVIKNNDLLKAINTWEDISKKIEIKEKTIDGKITELIPVYKVVNGKIVDGNKATLITKVTESDVKNISQPTNPITQQYGKNYQCQVVNKFDCDIDELKFEKDQKTVIVKNSNKITLVLNNIVITNKEKHFKVTAVKSYFEGFDYSKKLDIISNQLLENKKYSVLTPQFVVINDQIFSSREHNVVAKTASTITNNSNSINNFQDYKNCTSQTSNKEAFCIVYKLDTLPNNANASEALNFSGNLSLIKQASEIEANKFFVITIPDAKEDFLKKDTIINLGSTSTEQTKKFLFTVKDNIYLDFTTTKTASDDNSASKINYSHTINTAYILQ